MRTPILPIRVRRVAARTLVAAGMLVAGLAAAQAPAPVPATPPAPPTSAWLDPSVPARPAAEPDIPPVMRPPAVDTLATVRQRGVLRVGIVQVPPMVMRDRDGRPVGYSIDLARRLADDLGVQVAFVESSWAGVIPDLLERRTDVVVTGLWLSVPRALVVNFTQPTASEGVHLVASRARAGERRTLAAFDRPDVTLAVPADGLLQRVAQARFPRARLQAAEDPLAALVTGRADAALVATLAPEALLAAAGGRWFLPSPEPLARTAAGMAIRKGDLDFLAFLNTWLDLQREQGWLDERRRHWSTPQAIAP